MKNQLFEKKEPKKQQKLKSILQAAGGKVIEAGQNLLVCFETAVEILDNGYCLKINSSNKINVKDYGFYVSEGISEENPGNFTLMPTIVPVEC